MKNDRLSKHQVITIIDNCIKELSRLGPDFTLTDADFEFGELFEATGKQGCTTLGCRNHRFNQVVSFNANMFREGLEAIYINTVYHELLHILVNKYMINHDIIKIAAGDQLAVLDEDFMNKVSENEGHGGLWLKYAERVNALFELVIPISSHCSDEDVQKIFDASIADYGEPAIEINCQDCGKNSKFLTIDPDELPELPFLAKIYLDTKYKKSNNYCGICHGTLYIIIRDEEAEKAISEIADNFMMWAALGRLFGGNISA